MTQNQIAYWANVERERNNRETERIASDTQRSKAALERAQEQQALANQAKAQQDVLKSKYDIITNYLGASGLNSTMKLALGDAIANVLGVTPVGASAVKQLKDDLRSEQGWVSEAQKVIGKPVTIGSVTGRSIRNIGIR